MTTTRDPVVLPGDIIDPSLIQIQKKKQPIRVGTGLRAIPPSSLQATISGELVTEPKKNSLWIEYNGRRYIPSPSDLVIGQIHHTSADFYHVALNPYQPFALLPQLSFESASKKNRANLQPGQLVYARVALANKHMDPELECVSAQTGKAEGLGPLTGGTVFPVSLGLCRRLLMARSREDGGVAVLELLADEGLVFETAVGRNGKIWVSSESVKTAVIVGRALREVDEAGGGFGLAEQKKLVRRLLKEIK